MKKLMVTCVIGFIVVIAFSCGGGGEKSESTAPVASADKEEAATGNPDYDPKRGEGKFTTVELGANLDAAKADQGKKIFDVKCSACHKVTDEKLVGPGWAGVTSRHAPEWIMNFITNPDAMIDKDPKVQAQLEICLVRRPNQSLTDDDARNLLEFMRQNDGIK